MGAVRRWCPRRWGVRAGGLACVLVWVLASVLAVGVAPAAAFKPAAHVVLVEEVTAALPAGSACREALQTYPWVANLGANGPDLGYAQAGVILDRAPWADRFHYDRAGTMAAHQLQAALDSDDLRETAWAVGWLTHVLGDMAVHGLLVNPECGVYLAGGDKDLHKDLETWAEPYAWVRRGGHSELSYLSRAWTATAFGPGLSPFEEAFFVQQTQAVYAASPLVSEVDGWGDLFLTALQTGVGAYWYTTLSDAEANLSSLRRSRLNAAFDQARTQAVALLTAAEAGDYSGFTDSWNLDASNTDSRSMGTLVVTVRTSQVAGAGTDDDVYFGMRLGDGTEKEWKLDKPWYNDFEWGDEDDYYLFVDGYFPLHQVTNVWVRKSSDGLFGGWHLAHVDVRVNGQVVVAADAGVWLEHDHRRWELSNLAFRQWNRAPVAEARSVTTKEDTPLRVVLAASDPDGDPITYLLGERPAHGSLGRLENGREVVYSPDPDYVGPDSFTFRAHDGLDYGPPAAVSVTVTPDTSGDEPNDDPQTATRLWPGTARDGFVGRSGDVDWFYVDLPAYGGPHQVTVYLDPAVGKHYAFDVALCARGGWEGLAWPGWPSTVLSSGVVRAQGTAGPLRLYVVVRGVESADWSTRDSFQVRVDVTSTGSTVPVFPDVAGHAYREAVLELAGLGVVGGYQDGRFGPDDPVRRAQFTKMIAITLHLPVNEEITCPFTDLGVDDPTDLYPHEYVAAVAAAGITTGTSATTFSPWNNITLAQLVTMIVRAARDQLGPVPASYTPPFAAFDPTHYGNARIAAYHGLFAGFSDGYAWSTAASRGQCALLLSNLLHVGEE